MNDTPTPRTDKVWKKGGGLHSMDFHARTLERELTAVTEQRDRLAEAIRKHKFCDFELWDALQSLNQPTQ